LLHIEPSPKSQPESRENPQYASTRARDHGQPLSSSTIGQADVNGVHPSHLQVKIEAVDRLQAQMNHSIRGIEERMREISGLQHAIQLLDNNMRLVFQDLDVIKRELATRPPAPYVAPSGSVDDHTLEVFSQSLSQVQRKANEVDDLQRSLELVKRRVARLED